MKIFNTKTKNFTNSGLFPSSMLYPSLLLFPQHVDFNGDFSQGDEVVNPISCVEVKSKDEWYIEVELPLEYVSLIEQDTFLVVETKEKGEQPFRVNNVEIKTKIRCKANHVGYDTKLYSVELAFAINQTCEQALTAIIQNTVPSNTFTVYSDITDLNVFSVRDMQMYDALVYCAEFYGGVLEFDKFQIRIVSSIGSDKGLTLEYGVNIQESEVYEDWSNVVTRLKPIGNDGIILNPEWLVADVQYDKPYTKILHFDSSNLDDLYLASTLYLARWKYPQVNYKVKAYINEALELGDTVQVKSRQFTLDATILSYKYNVLTKSMKEIEFGNYRRTTQNAFETLKTETVKVTQQVIDQAGYIKSLADDEVVTVGTGGDFPNINDALFYLSFKYPRFKDESYPYLVSSAEILLLSGFVMNEQVIIERMNLGFITISSEDAEVTVNRSVLTQAIVSGGTSYYPVFVAKENAVLPVINCLFDLNATGVDSNRVGVMCIENSSATIRSGCGFKMNSTVTIGCFATEGSNINADGSIFNGSGNAYFAKYNSRINANGITTSDNNFGALAEECSTININNSTIINSNADGVQANRGSTINANSCNINSWGFSGVRSFYGSVINVTSSNCRDGGSDSANDIRVFGGSIVQANSSTGGLSQTANTITSNGIIFK